MGGRENPIHIVQRALEEGHIDETTHGLLDGLVVMLSCLRRSLWMIFPCVFLRNTPCCLWLPPFVCSVMSYCRRRTAVILAGITVTPFDWTVLTGV